MYWPKINILVLKYYGLQFKISRKDARKSFASQQGRRKGNYGWAFLFMIDQTVMKSKKDFDYWIGLALDYNRKAKSSKSKIKKK